MRQETRPPSSQSLVHAALALEHYSRNELLRTLRQVRQADLSIKSSWKDSKLLLEFLVWQIAVGRGTRPADEAFESGRGGTEDSGAAPEGGV